MITLDDAAIFQQLPNVHPQLHAKRLDRFLGYRIPKIEVKLLQKFRGFDQSSDSTNRKGHFEGAQTWIGLHPQALQTPYNYIYEALYQLRDYSIGTVVDIGCAYGRVGMVMQSIYPKARFIGYEVVKTRANEANRIFSKYQLAHCEVIQTNILSSDFTLPKADVYFIYDFGNIHDIHQALRLIVTTMQTDMFFLVVRGDRVDSILNNPNQRNVRWTRFATTTGFTIFTHNTTPESH